MRESNPPPRYLKVVALVVILVGLALKEGFNRATTFPPPAPAQPTPVPVLTPTSALTPIPELTPVPTPPPSAVVMVWVNTNSGVYHCPNTRWYGNTKSGRFMTQDEAQAKGYRPAYGAKCG